MEDLAVGLQSYHWVMQHPISGDWTMWMYLLHALTAMYGAGLFTWWWIRSGKASRVYMCVTILFAGEFCAVIIEAYARAIFFIFGADALADFIRSNVLWSWRHVVILAALIALTFHMSIRLFYIPRNPPGNRREGDG